MRKIALATLMLISPLLGACHKNPPDINLTSADANEDAALNTLEAENNEAQGIGYAVSGMLPDENGQVPMANVQ